MDGSALIRAGVLVNPLSGRKNGKGFALANALKQTPDVAVAVISAFAEIEPAIRRFCSANVEIIVVSSGDGTIQYVQTLLAEVIKPARMPMLCLLPHGTTNMTAADIGFRRSSIADQAAFIATPEPHQVLHRSTLRVSNARDGIVRHGMFMGTGALPIATRYCQKVLNDRGIHGDWASGATLALAIFRSVFGRNPETRFDKPHDVFLAVDDVPLTEGVQVMALCTTLDRLILGSRPFWGGAAGPIRSTSIAYPIVQPWRWAKPILYGKEVRNLPDFARSAAGRTVKVSSSTEFVLDGEFFNGPETGFLLIETGPELTYAVG
jgi:diacylglycerol kinase (ATP)